MDSNQISSDDKDFQVLLVNGPKMRPTYPRWQMNAKIEKFKIPATIWPILTKFGMVMHLGPLHPIDYKNFRNLKIQDGEQPPSWQEALLWQRDRATLLSVEILQLQRIPFGN